MVKPARRNTIHRESGETVGKKPSKKKPTRKKRKQADDFVSVARRLGCDEDKATFEAKLAKIAKAKPKN